MLYHWVACIKSLTDGYIFTYSHKSKGLEVTKKSLPIPFQDSLYNYILMNNLPYVPLNSLSLYSHLSFFFFFQFKLLRELEKRERYGGEFRVGERGGGKKQLMMVCCETGLC